MQWNRIREAALRVMAATGVLGSSAEVLGGDAPAWWHAVTVTAAVVGVVAHAVDAAARTPPMPDGS